MEPRSSAASAAASPSPRKSNVQLVSCPICSQKLFPWSMPFHTKACEEKRQLKANMPAPAFSSMPESPPPLPSSASRRAALGASPSPAAAAALTPNKTATTRQTTLPMSSSHSPLPRVHRGPISSTPTKRPIGDSIIAQPLQDRRREIDLKVEKDRLVKRLAEIEAELARLSVEKAPVTPPPPPPKLIIEEEVPPCATLQEEVPSTPMNQKREAVVVMAASASLVPTPRAMTPSPKFAFPPPAATSSSQGWEEQDTLIVEDRDTPLPTATETETATVTTETTSKSKSRKKKKIAGQ